jgi:hypothetical protein
MPRYYNICVFKLLTNREILYDVFFNYLDNLGKEHKGNSRSHYARHIIVKNNQICKGPMRHTNVFPIKY